LGKSVHPKSPHQGVNVRLWPATNCRHQKFELKYWTDFIVALKMINVINKKQMYDSVITGKENASKE